MNINVYVYTFKLYIKNFKCINTRDEYLTI